MTKASAHRGNHLEKHSRAVLDGSAVAVLPSVVAGGEEFTQEVAVGPMYLNAVETRLFRALGRVGKGLGNAVDVVLRHGAADLSLFAFQHRGPYGLDPCLSRHRRGSPRARAAL